MKITTVRNSFLSLAVAASLIINAGCNSLTKTQKGAAIGAGAGGTIGAFIGKSAGNTALGAIIGGAIGGTAGAFIGRKMDRQAAEIQQTVPGATVTREGEGIIVKFDSGILFDVNKTDLKSAARTNLQNLATSLEKNPDTNILIVGHTDNTGSDQYNQDLSVRRAQSVKSYLTTAGVPSGRLSTQGKGESEPIGDNSTEAGRAQNRRVEIVIVANDQLKEQARQQGGE
ncbi:OmpA family protein [Mucilaginibacter sp. RS28]|uniref:OmpA family protein n=1 Tax=Mucilaginibacter straminoryzae TaxID=2932774 RepID=A0A9X1X663_9SPHI|nr:OmpA family protein [Mucilaginibacter straminoryzae]MCJ8211779.1 OmpA family protein [Mucilaginibacter straminoryzae]